MNVFRAWDDAICLMSRRSTLRPEHADGREVIEARAGGAARAIRPLPFALLRLLLLGLRKF